MGHHDIGTPDGVEILGTGKATTLGGRVMRILTLATLVTIALGLLFAGCSDSDDDGFGAAGRWDEHTYDNATWGF